MRRISAQRVNDLLEETRSELERLNDEYSLAVKPTNSARVHESDLSIQKTTAEFKYELVQQAAVIKRGIPDNVAELREQLLKLRDKTESKRISIRTLETTEQRIVELAEELQEICAHPVVIYFEGYRGSRSYDYEDKRPSQRTCIICGIRDNSYGEDMSKDYTRRHQNEPDYKILTTIDDRAVIRFYDVRDVFGDDEKNDERRYHVIRTSGIWQPLKDMLPRLIDSRVHEMLRSS